MRIDDMDIKNESVAVFCTSDTLVRLLAPVVHALRGKGVEVRCYFSTRQEEGANAAFREQQCDCVPLTLRSLLRFRPSSILLGNDWGPEPRLLCALGLLTGWRTVCVQESVVDFDARVGRLRRADIACFQGAISAGRVCRDGAVITGNPRYEALQWTANRTEAPAMINCNFTYGVHEDKRRNWLSAVCNSLAEDKRDFFISQHPRDRSDLSEFGEVRPSSARLVHSQITSAALVITRFSSLIHEALLLGRPVLYYNPHGEEMHYDFGRDSSTYRFVSRAEDLGVAVRDLLAKPTSKESCFAQLEGHLVLEPPSPSERIAEVVMRAGTYQRVARVWTRIKDLAVYPINAMLGRG